MFWKDVFNQKKSRAVIMGILNVTPDSFSDGGQYIHIEQAIDHALAMIEQGADILDIGGESTRPGANPITPQQEQDRIMPVVEALLKENIPLSIDTKNTATMSCMLEAGVEFINDVNALQDEGAIDLLAKHDAYCCLMHMQNTPETMQANPSYTNVIQDIIEFLTERIALCVEAGIDKEKISIDPGIGFGKTLENNLTILKNIHLFHDLGCPVLLGTSRKSFISKLYEQGAPADQRLGGSISSILWGLNAGVELFRVHDVYETKQAFDIWQAIQQAEAV